ncbi:hypothetical protein BDA96_10G039000 [Sorghum bicolor]|uniref:Uncharacterized protein n=2 Tax=Sorghum bicolor TaxID=4558 RepID=A0A921PYU7_SORBI|nr:hypothetical protein BDA96_10G039000 [Sorghum bicolor]KXG19277.1 hypothetical protein SORBI_3010G033900 [Sorghum bicolor]
MAPLQLHVHYAPRCYAPCSIPICVSPNLAGRLKEAVGVWPADSSKQLTLPYRGRRRPPQIWQRLLFLSQW